MTHQQSLSAFLRAPPPIVMALAAAMLGVVWVCAPCLLAGASCNSVSASKGTDRRAGRKTGTLPECARFGSTRRHPYDRQIILQQLERNTEWESARQLAGRCEGKCAWESATLPVVGNAMCQLLFTSGTTRPPARTALMSTLASDGATLVQMNTAPHTCTKSSTSQSSASAG